ncbi:PLP-dependent aspartate aminotransferase family protein [Alkalihalobacillus sp. AL-G]|uniref:trans-sulfuration enzyme family protein n=1 Tax=Alkalihalobacillus sp. AL-G TaxID=2926399 RepID=UPI00272D889F|nr:aminotransferase class I/II-fold pyridoxal phosphate-dependent enzyme [Alkalihalobacillus sp. AL-G]WLD93676.1 aminotransferase class I/II-fold pyridoxal phosphate-dependent enzyme [Alkalihalobacillus sp. AL-G]
MSTFRFDSKTVHFHKRITSESVSKAQPIYQTSAFKFRNLDELEGFFQGVKPYMYSRVSNPNTDDLGTGVAQLEGAPAGIATSSGISAILAGILSVTEQGSHIVACEDLYGGTYQLLANELPSFGIEVTFVSFEDKVSIQSAIQPNTVLLYTESITNPLLRVEDIEQLVRIGKKHNVHTMVDNTFASPYLLQPYLNGVSLVVHSATKYIGGHSDVTAGVVAGDEALIEKAKSKVVNLGSNLSPFEAWLACRGMKTLSVRMERHVKNAELLAGFLSGCDGIGQVYYPKNASEKGNGAIVTVSLDEGIDANEFCEKLDWIGVVPTLAGVETTVSYPLGTSHRALPPSEQKKLGIHKNLIRISVGIEDFEDIREAFANALK